ncbi:MAG: DNA-binding domain-containing protein [Pseudomonadota bacterium]
MSAFHDYVRGRSDALPTGYAEAGMRLYRHLVYLGVEQLLAAHFPEVQAALGEDDWRALLQAFIRESRWDSPFYGDMKDDFVVFLQCQGA